MLSSLLYYLVETSLYLAVFALAYRLLLSKLSFFSWNRLYLISSLVLSLSIPFFSIPSLLPAMPKGFEAIAGTGLAIGKPPFPSELWISPYLLEKSIAEQGEPYALMVYGILLMYLSGCLYKTWRLQQSLYSIYKMINRGHKQKKGAYVVVENSQNLTPFSFLHYIFIPENKYALNEGELKQVLDHEIVHVRQRHTLDLLFFEMASIVLWFNPLIYYLSTQIRDVHEYIVDSTIIRSGGRVKEYGQLLLKLVSVHSPSSLMNTFSNKQIFNRIQMLIQTKSKPMQRFRFLIVLPVTGLIVLLSSFTENGNTTFEKAISGSPEVSPTIIATDSTIRKISWLGNTVYTDEVLSKALGIQEGDSYSKVELERLLAYKPGEKDFASIYMDKGYLFFNVNIKEVPVNKSVDLAITVQEGPQVKVGEIIIKGNTKIAREELLKKIGIRPGELFNRSKVFESLQVLAQMDQFNQESIQFNPIPDEVSRSGKEGGKVDLEYVLDEI